jgi:hypothetical protein
LPECVFSALETWGGIRLLYGNKFLLRSLGAKMKLGGNGAKRSILTIIAAAGLATVGATPGRAQSIQQQVVQGVIENILQDIRDQIQSRQLIPPLNPRRYQFTGEESEFNSRDPFNQTAKDAFGGLAYTKAPPMAPPPPPTWIYGINAVGSIDKSTAGFISTQAVAGTGAFDATKIGIFTASDALTFVLTGTGIWTHTFGLDTDTGSGAGTIAYTNGGFSADFTAAGSESRSTLLSVGIGAAPPDSSSLSYTGNVQYKYDLPYHFFVEPTAGVTYTQLYSANFGTETGDSTEVHGGARFGSEMDFSGFRVTPQVSAVAFQIVDATGALAPGMAAIAGAAAGTNESLGVRTSAKINVNWTPHFSSYAEVHNSYLPPDLTHGVPSLSTTGGQVGLRYTW